MLGYEAFVHVSKYKRSKLDSKAKQGIFLGYAHEEFGYKLWDSVNKKLLWCRDIFFEHQTMKTWIRLKRQRPAMKNMLICIQFFLLM